MKDTRPQIQEAQKIPRRINTKKSTPKHITVKLQETKDKKKMLKEAKGKQQQQQTLVEEQV